MIVIVRVDGWLVEVSMPKSTSLGEKASGFGVAVVGGMIAVCGAALSACAVRVPGFDEVLVSATVHSPAGARVRGQLWVRLKSEAVS